MLHIQCKTSGLCSFIEEPEYWPEQKKNIDQPLVYMNSRYIMPAHVCKDSGKIYKHF